MLHLVLWVGLAAGGPAPAPVKLASPGLTLVDVDPAKGGFFSERLATAMVSDGLRVLTTREIGALLGLERQKALIGCSDADSSCLAELGAALGVDGVLLGDLAHIGKRFELTAKVVSAGDGKVLAVQTGRANSEEELSDLVVELGQRLAAELLERLGRKAPAPKRLELTAVAESPGVRRFAWIPCVVGGLGAIVTGLMIAVADEQTADLRRMDSGSIIDVEEARMKRDAGNQTRTYALLTGLASGAFVLGGIAMIIFGGPREASVAAWATPSSAGITVGGAWP